MYIVALNCSPRRNGATATLLKKALEGAASQGAKTELIQLNKLKMSGCLACFDCKKRGGKSYGKCSLKDDMALIYEKIESSDGFLLGSPIYFGTITALAKMFVERLYPYLNYGDYTSNFPKKINTGLVYTMGIEGDQVKTIDQIIQFNQVLFSFLFGSAETIISTDTFHVEDYSKIVADMLELSVNRKLKHRKEVFPRDCEKAFQMGAKFAKGSKESR